MKQKTKRTIAREGLIILSLILLAGLSGYVYSSLENVKSKFEKNAQEVEVAQQGKKLQPPEPLSEAAKEWIRRWGDYGAVEEIEKKRIPKWVDVLIPKGIIVLFPKGTSNYAIEKTIRRDSSYIDKVDFITYDKPRFLSTIDRYYDSEGNRKFESFIYKINFGEIALILILAVYPSYLLIRFIVWSIKTLKSRTGENE